MNGLGRLFDIGVGVAPVDVDTANGATGKRCSMVNASGITAVAFFGVGPATDVTLTVKQHTAATGGTTANAAADAVSAAYIKSEAVLDNDEAWVSITPDPLNPVITLAGATYGAVQKIVAVEIDAKKLGSVIDSGYTHVSLDIAGTLAASLLGAVIYIAHGLRVSRTPVDLANLGTGVAVS